MLIALGRLPYLIALGLLRLCLATTFTGKLRSWPRNSFLTNAFLPGKSDLDISHCWRTAPTIDECRRLTRIHKIIKAVFPALGENNVYCEEDWALLEGVINPYELARDPKLLKLQPKLMEPRTPAAAVVWLLRLLDADIANLRQNPAQRLLKWRAHFKAALPGSGLDASFSIDTVFERIEALAPEASLRLKESYEWMWQRDREAQPAWLQVARPDFPSTLFLLFPQRYCFHTAGSLGIPRENILWEIFVHQVRWEIFGAYTQFRNFESCDSLLTHLQNLDAWIAANEKSQRELPRLKLVLGLLGRLVGGSVKVAPSEKSVSSC